MPLIVCADKKARIYPCSPYWLMLLRYLVRQAQFPNHPKLPVPQTLEFLLKSSFLLLLLKFCIDRQETVVFDNPFPSGGCTKLCEVRSNTDSKICYEPIVSF